MSYQKMNEEVRKAWVKKLRSQQYEQTINYLNVDGKYCCLGVLSIVVDEMGLNDDYTWGEIEPWVSVWIRGDEEITASIPEQIRETIGLDDDAQEQLVEFNDEKGWSFEQIALWIQNNL